MQIIGTVTTFGRQRDLMVSVFLLRNITNQAVGVQQF
jgi:hypothetical protein